MSYIYKPVRKRELLAAILVAGTIREKREPPLSWGLQHYVRGDLVFDDGSVVTLDRLAIGKGVPGPITRHLQDLYERAVRAAGIDYRDWVTTIRPW